MIRILPALLLIVTSAQAFNIISYNGKPTHWPRPEITYTVDSGGSSDFTSGCDRSGTCESERSAVQKAFTAWSEVPGVNLNFREASPQANKTTGYDGKNSVVFINSGWTDLSFKPPTGALAVTITTYRLDNGQILDADIHFNGQYFTWGVINSDAERRGGRIVDIQNVGTHEVGHFLGLGHSSENYSETDTSLYMATMFFASGPGETFRRALKPDDIAAVKHLYPEAGEERPVVDSILPRDIDARTISVATVEISGANFKDSTSVTIVRNNDRGDVVGKIVSRTEDSMHVSFEMFGLGSGDYDVIVANTLNAQERVPDALSIVSYATESSQSESTSGGGGCAAGSVGAFEFILLMIGLPILLIFPGRLQGMPVKAKKNQNPFFKHRRF